MSACTFYVPEDASLLDIAQRLVREEIDNLEHSAPQSILNRLSAIASDFQSIEDIL